MENIAPILKPADSRQRLRQNQHIAIISHPLFLTRDGRRDLILRPDGAPKNDVVPLYDHHELESAPIGIVNLEYLSLGKVNGLNLCFVTGMIYCSSLPLKPKQAVSIGAPLVNSVGINDILGDILEVSLVDKPMLGGCMCLPAEEAMQFIPTLSLRAPSLLKELQRELASQ